MFEQSGSSIDCRCVEEEKLMGSNLVGIKCFGAAGLGQQGLSVQGQCIASATRPLAAIQS